MMASNWHAGTAAQCGAALSAPHLHVHHHERVARHLVRPVAEGLQVRLGVGEAHRAKVVVELVDAVPHNQRLLRRQHKGRDVRTTGPPPFKRAHALACQSAAWTAAASCKTGEAARKCAQAGNEGSTKRRAPGGAPQGTVGSHEALCS